MLSRMGQIQDPYGLGVVVVEEGLAPHGSIHDRPHTSSTLDTSSLEFRKCLFGKGGTVRHPREIREVRGVNHWSLTTDHWWLHVTNSHRPNFPPLTPNEGDHGPIDADNQGGWSWWWLRVLVQDAFRFRRFVGNEHGTSGFGTSSSGIGMDGGSRVPRELNAGFRKGALGGTQAHEGLVEPGRQGTRK